MMKKNLTVFFVFIVCSVFIFACGKADTKGDKETKATESTGDVSTTETAESIKATESAGAEKSTESVEDIQTPEAAGNTNMTETVGDTNDTETENNTDYWLCGTGITDGPDYVGGICKVYFKQNAIVLEGNLLKSLSQEDYGEQIGTVVTYAGEEIEVSTDCKVIQDEGNDEKAYAYRDYIESRELSETENAAGIYIAITVKNGKVVEIYYSA